MPVPAPLTEEERVHADFVHHDVSTLEGVYFQRDLGLSTPRSLMASSVHICDFDEQAHEPWWQLTNIELTGCADVEDL